MVRSGRKASWDKRGGGRSLDVNNYNQQEEEEEEESVAVFLPYYNYLLRVN